MKPELPKIKDYKVMVECITYNHANYIKDTLNGFSIQKTDFPFICVVFEDCSIDGEAEVIKNWIQKECNISAAEFINLPTSEVIIVTHSINTNCNFAFYFHKENLWRKPEIRESLSLPWRKKCQYVALCEGDDYWIASFKLQMQVNMLEMNLDCSLCCGGFIRRHGYHFSIDEVKFNTKVPYFKFTLDDWGSYWYTKTLTLMYRANAIVDFESGKFKLTRDVHVCFHLLKKGDGIYFNDMLGVYNMHEGGIFSLTSSDSKLITNYKIYSEIYTYYNDKSSRQMLYNAILNVIISKPKSLSLLEMFEMLKTGMAISGNFKQKIKLILAIIYKPKSLLKFICKP